MRSISFEALCDSIHRLEEPSKEVARYYESRIFRLIDHCKPRWEELYEKVGSAESWFCPYHSGVPDDVILDDQHEDINKSVVEIFVENFEVLSSGEWFDCEPATWLGIVAADQLDQGIAHYKLLKYALEQAGEEADPEFVKFLPVQIPLGYWRCSEALIAAEMLIRQSQLRSDERTSRAQSGGIARNKLFRLAREKFIDFYIEDPHSSKAEAARRFYRQTLNWPSDERPRYVHEESAVRAFLEALRKAGI